MNSRKYMDLEWIKNVTVTWCAWGSWCFFTNYLVAEFDKILFIIVGGMVFLLMPAISQVAILKAVRRQSREIAPAATNCITVTRAREKKMMVTVRYILAAVFGSVVPSTLTGIATVVTGSRSAQTFLSPFPMTMFCLSSCLNPLVYFWRHLDMRSAALALVGRWVAQVLSTFCLSLVSRALLSSQQTNFYNLAEQFYRRSIEGATAYKAWGLGIVEQVFDISVFKQWRTHI